MSKSSSSNTRAALNRLLLSCRDEVMALEAAALTARGERSKRLHQQASRRVIFQRDLGAGVVALGGVPATRVARGTGLARAVRTARGFFVRPQRVDLYEACARATEKTARLYVATLNMDLPEDVRFGLERQHTEVEFDRKELRWLRFGGNLTQEPVRSSPGLAPTPVAVELSAQTDARALARWGDDGGRVAGDRNTQAALPGT